MRELVSPTPVTEARAPTGPVVIWNLIRRCNLTCKHCYSISADRDFPGELTTRDVYRVMDDLRAFGLGDAAGDRDHGLATLLAGVLAQAANIRIDLLGRLFANVAGVEHHQIGGAGVVGRRRIDSICWAKSQVWRPLGICDKGRGCPHLPRPFTSSPSAVR